MNGLAYLKEKALLEDMIQSFEEDIERCREQIEELEASARGEEFENE